ncbi:MAG: endo alpha-1,4 polygalactosaminidase, partial [Hydrogenobaculum sp.]
LPNPQCVMVYYGDKDIPLDVLHAYSMVITNPNAKFVKKIRMLFYEKHLPKFIGYLSVGELDEGNRFYNQLKAFAIGKNKMWHSKILDVTNENYQKFLVDKEAKYILKQGFDGFFLDTLNSYKLIIPKKDWKSYQAAIVNIVKALREKYPNKIIIVNRGFSVFSSIRPYINGVLVESLFKGINAKKEYVSTSQNTTNKLLNTLSHIKDSGVPVIVLDYANNKEEAFKDINRIKSYGFIPYVSNYNLDKVGYSMCNPVRKNIVLLYKKTNGGRQATFINNVIQPILEYLGYVPFLYNVNNKRLPSLKNTGFKAIISHYMHVTHKEYFESYVSKALEDSIKLFFINKIPLDNDSFLDELGIQKERNNSSKLSGFDIVYKAPGYGYEAPLILEYPHHLYNAKGDALVKAKNQDGEIFTPFVFTKWGGFALNGSFVNFNGLFVYNPFKVFKKLLKPNFPAIDYTTENGARILIAFVDGDDFPGRSKINTQKTTGQILYDRILTHKKYDIPISISIIAGDISSHGRYPDKSIELKQIAKRIFELPNVEPASHAFSHPYHWRKVLKEPNAPRMRIMIPGYKYSQRYEIFGSINILDKLTPPDKPVNLLQWSGNADPDRKALLMTYKAKVYNIN